MAWTPPQRFLDASEANHIADVVDLSIVNVSPASALCLARGGRFAEKSDYSLISAFLHIHTLREYGSGKVTELVHVEGINGEGRGGKAEEGEKLSRFAEKPHRRRVIIH